MSRPFVDRYLEPARVLLASPTVVRKVAATLRAACRAEPVARALPAGLDIDVSDACNLSCTVCSRSIRPDRRDVAIMDLPCFKRIFDASRPAYLLISGYGETLLCPDLPRMVAWARGQKATVSLVTNGTLLDEARSRALLDAGLAKLKVSVDGADSATYARFRQGGQLDEVIANVRRFMDLRGSHPAIVELQMVLFRDNIAEMPRLVELCRRRLPGVQPNFMLMFTYGEQPGFVDRTISRGDTEAVAEALGAIAAARALCERHGLRRARGSLDVLRIQLTRDLSTAPCYMPWYQANIATDGEVYPCCHHSIHGRSMGNALQVPFDEIWNDAPFRGFRRRLRADRSADPVCATCRHEDGPMDRFLETLRFPRTR